MTDQWTLLHRRIDSRTKLAMASWLRLAPILYNSTGHPRAQIPDLSIDNSSGSEFENAYADLWRHHLLPLLLKHPEAGSDKTLKSLINDHKRDFMQKTVGPAIALGSQGSNALVRARVLSLEEMPFLVALFRGYFGGDCSIGSVPNYVALNDVRVFLIRKSAGFGGRPDGYLLAVRARVGGEEIPYFLTVNGVSLSVMDTAAAVRLAAKIFGVEQVLLPDHQKVPNLVNSEAARLGMQSRDPHPVSVQFPDGWALIDQKPQDGVPADIYDQKTLAHAFLSRVEDLPVLHFATSRIMRAQNPYQNNEQVKSMALKDRAILAANLLSGPGEKHTLEILRRLNLNQAQLEAGLSLLQPSGLSVFAYRRAVRDLGLVFSDLGKLSTLARISTLTHLDFEGSDVASPEEMNNMYLKSSKELDRDARNKIRQGISKDEVKSYFIRKEQIPPAVRRYPEDIIQQLMENTEVLSEKSRLALAVKVLGFTEFNVESSLVHTLRHSDMSDSHQADKFINFARTLLTLAKNTPNEAQKKLLESLEEEIVDRFSSANLPTKSAGFRVFMKAVANHARGRPNFGLRLARALVESRAEIKKIWYPADLVLLRLRADIPDARLMIFLRQHLVSVTRQAFNSDVDGGREAAFRVLEILRDSANPAKQKLYLQAVARMRELIHRGGIEKFSIIEAVSRIPEVSQGKRIQDMIKEILRELPKLKGHVYVSSSIIASFSETLVSLNILDEPLVGILIHFLDDYVKERDRILGSLESGDDRKRIKAVIANFRASSVGPCASLLRLSND